MTTTPEYLPQLHKTEVEILDEIVRICNKYNLKYYLIGGTLLGAVRHKGFIPWDDDLDIVMPRKDYVKFCQLCATELAPEYYLHGIDTDPTYWLVFAKIRKRNTLFNERNIAPISAPKGIYVDIFPLDEALSEDSLEQRIRTRIIKGLSATICRKRGLDVRPSLKGRILMQPLLLFSIYRLSMWQLKLMTKQNHKKCDYYINFGSNYNTVKQTIHKSKYEPSCQVEFEGKLYNTLGDYAYFLKRIYGEDYMQLPPPEKRITHRPVRISFDMAADGLEKELNDEKI